MFSLVKLDRSPCSRFLVVGVHNKKETGDFIVPKLTICRRLWEMGIHAEQMVLEKLDVKSQLGFAEKNEFSFVILIGHDELKDQTFKLKNISTRQENVYPLENLEDVVRNIC
jgi:histidyl-tRNA synthetase